MRRWQQRFVALDVGIEAILPELRQNVFGVLLRLRSASKVRQGGVFFDEAANSGCVGNGLLFALPFLFFSLGCGVETANGVVGGGAQQKGGGDDRGRDGQVTKLHAS